MEYIFEDKKGSMLDLILRRIYPDEVYSHFHFTGNNNRAQDKANKFAKGEISCIVFLDMVPGNKQVSRVYEEIVKSSKKYNYRINVIPIYCSEFLIIKAFHDLPIFKNTTNIQLCLNKFNYLTSSLYNVSGRFDNYKTFEKYCKLILKYDAINCITTDKRILIDGLGYTKNTLNQIFLNSDCKYKLSNEPLSLNSKLLRILEAFPAFPSGNKICSKVIEVNEWDLHKSLIDELNDFVNMVSNNELLRDECKRFEYIK